MDSRDSSDSRSSRRRIPIRRPDEEQDRPEQTSENQEAEESDATRADDQQDTGQVPARVLEAFERELIAARRERDQWEEKYHQARADVESMRRRLQRAAEIEAFEEQRRTLRRMLEVADNLERAIEATGESETDLAQGVRLTYRELLRAFRELGVEQIDALGEPFDPTYHDAVNVVERPDVPGGTVVDEEQKGYTYRDQVLRPAKVWVAKE